MSSKHLANFQESMRDNHPKHRQGIYRTAYNTWEESDYEDEQAHRAACAALLRRSERRTKRQADRKRRPERLSRYDGDEAQI